VGALAILDNMMTKVKVMIFRPNMVEKVEGVELDYGIVSCSIDKSLRLDTAAPLS